MKKITALWLALALALTFGSTAFAAGVSGVNVAAEPDPIFSDYHDDQLEEGFIVHIPLGYSAFLPGESDITPSEVTQSQLDSLSVTAGDQQAQLDELFTYDLQLQYPGTDNAVVWINLVAKPVASRTGFDFRLGLVDKRDSAQSTPQINRGRFSGAINPVESAITGFNPDYQMSDIKEVPSEPGKTHLLPVPDSAFLFAVGSGMTLTPEKAGAVGLRAAVTDDDIVATVVKKNNQVFVQLSVSQSAVVGLHTFDVYLRGYAGAIDGQDFFLQTLNFNVVGPLEQEEIPLADSAAQQTADNTDNTNNTDTADNAAVSSRTSSTVQATTTLAAATTTETLLSLKDDAQAQVYSLSMIKGGDGYAFPIRRDSFNTEGTPSTTHAYLPDTLATGITITKDTTVANSGYFDVNFNSKDGWVFDDKFNQITGLMVAEVYLNNSATPGVYNLKLNINYKNVTKPYLDLTVTVTEVNLGDYQITGIDSNARLGVTNAGIEGVTRLNGDTVADTESLTVTSGDQITVNFDSDFFTWEHKKTKDNTKPAPAVYLPSSAIRAGKIDVRILKSKTSDIIDKAEIRYEDGQAFLQIYFVEQFVSTKSKDFEVEIVLTYNKKYDKDTALILAGTIENNYIELYENDDYVDLSEGDVAEAMENIKSIDVDIGEGAIIHAKMSKGKKYYGVATIDVKTSDEDMLEQYPDIEFIYYLDTIGLNSTSNTVTLDVGSKMHAYNANMEYLGTTDKKLPYSTKYYLSTTELDVTAAGGDSGDDVVELPVTSAPQPEETGDSILPPSNPNQNPATGR